MLLLMYGRNSHPTSINFRAPLVLNSPSQIAHAWAYAAQDHYESGTTRQSVQNGRNQAVRIPREFAFPSEDAIMRKEGNRLIIEPAPPKSLLAVLATLQPLSEDFPAIVDLPPDPVDF